MPSKQPTWAVGGENATAVAAINEKYIVVDFSNFKLFTMHPDLSNFPFCEVCEREGK